MVSRETRRELSDIVNCQEHSFESADLQVSLPTGTQVDALLTVLQAPYPCFPAIHLFASDAYFARLGCCLGTIRLGLRIQDTQEVQGRQAEVRYGDSVSHTLMVSFISERIGLKLFSHRLPSILSALLGIPRRHRAK